MFGKFLNERVCFDAVKIENGEGIDPIVDRWGKEESFVVKVLLDFVEVVLGTGANRCCHVF